MAFAKLRNHSNFGVNITLSAEFYKIILLFTARNNFFDSKAHKRTSIENLQN